MKEIIKIPILVPGLFCLFVLSPVSLLIMDFLAGSIANFQEIPIPKGKGQVRERLSDFLRYLRVLRG